MGYFTTKIHTRTGPYRSFGGMQADIKRKRKQVGTIKETVNEAGLSCFVVSFAFKKQKTEADPAPFHWRRLTQRFGTFSEALNFVRNMKKPSYDHELYEFED